MAKRIILIIAVIVVFIGAAAYFVLRHKQSSQQPVITNFQECVRAGYPVGESYPRQCWTPDGKHFVEDITQSVSPIAGSVTIAGEIACLPKKGSGAQTLECAIGLKGEDGNYYALKNLSERDPEHKFSQTGLMVEVKGILSTEEISAPDGNKYNIAGVITLDSVREKRLKGRK
jgi:flagellar basal body-associated protein FliL